jgi:hypothetical protein
MQESVSCGKKQELRAKYWVKGYISLSNFSYAQILYSQSVSQSQSKRLLLKQQFSIITYTRHNVLAIIISLFLCRCKTLSASKFIIWVLLGEINVEESGPNIEWLGPWNESVGGWPVWGLISKDLRTQENFDFMSKGQH